MSEYTKILLEEDEIPTQWYNVVPDLPEPPPPQLHPGTLQPATARNDGGPSRVPSPSSG